VLLRLWPGDLICSQHTVADYQGLDELKVSSAAKAEGGTDVIAAPKHCATQGRFTTSVLTSSCQVAQGTDGSGGAIEAGGGG
jgi:hypothetical protein